MWLCGMSIQGLAFARQSRICRVRCRAATLDVGNWPITPSANVRYPEGPDLRAWLLPVLRRVLCGFAAAGLSGFFSLSFGMSASTTQRTCGFEFLERLPNATLTGRRHHATWFRRLGFFVMCPRCRSQKRRTRSAATWRHSYDCRVHYLNLGRKSFLSTIFFTYASLLIYDRFAAVQNFYVGR